MSHEEELVGFKAFAIERSRDPADLRAREEIARALYECDYPNGTWKELKQAAKTHGVPWPTFTAAPYYRRADAVERCIGEPAVLKPLIASGEGEPDREAGLSAGSPILPRTAGQEWRDRAIKIIADENRFATTDDPRNMQLYTLRVARIATARQILGEIPMPEPVLAGAIAASFPAPPVTEPIVADQRRGDGS